MTFEDYFSKIDYTMFNYKYPEPRKIAHLKLVVDNTKPLPPTPKPKRKRKTT